MPLPDERPRASVANLIGRFEQQNRRAPSASQTPVAPIFKPRTSDAAASTATATDTVTVTTSSQTTTDSRQEEETETEASSHVKKQIGKFKHGWPPKPSGDAVKDARGTTPSVKDPDPPPAAAPESSRNGALPAKTTTTMNRKPSSTQADKTPAPPSTLLEPAKPAPPLVTPPSQAQPLPPSMPTASQPPSTPPKPTLSKASGVTRTKPALQPLQQQPALQPLRAHHTGSSLATGSLKARQGSMLSRSRTPPHTKLSSARSKTPSSASAPQPSNNSSSSNHPRPKTPGSGLFAPTAASLARSRNAELPPPPPVRKVTLSSGVMERLSKPTAASASKVRAPAVAASPPRKMTASASTGGTAGGASVSRAGTKVIRKPKSATAVGEAMEKGGVEGAASGKVAGEEDVVASHEEEHMENGNEMEESGAKQREGGGTEAETTAVFTPLMSEPEAFSSHESAAATQDILPIERPTADVPAPSEEVEEHDKSASSLILNRNDIEGLAELVKAPGIERMIDEALVDEIPDED